MQSLDEEAMQYKEVSDSAEWSWLMEGLVERNTGFVVSRVGRGRILLLGDAIIDSETASLTKYQQSQNTTL